MKKRSGDSSRLGDVGEMLMQKPPLGTPLDWENPLNDGCVMHLAMNEGHGDKVQDLSLNGNNRTLHNFAFPPTTTSGWNPGQNGVGIRFDGINDYINCGDTPRLQLTTQATVNFLVKMDSGSGNNYFISKRDNAPVAGYEMVYYNDILTFSVRNVGDTKTAGWTQAGLDDGEWHHAAGTYDKTNLKVYWDGNEKGIESSTIDIGTSSQSLRISGRGYDGLHPVHGFIDQPRVQSRAWSAKEVKDYAMNPWQVYLQP